MKRERGRVYYSSNVPGNVRSHRMPVKFDYSDGYIGVTQYDDDGVTLRDRILLSPAQWKALKNFVEPA